MQSATLMGVELDSITGRLAKQLYPQANITVDGFERVNLPDNSIDLAVGNVPFGSYKLADPRYDKQSLLIHDYFFVKTLDKVRPCLLYTSGRTCAGTDCRGRSRTAPAL